MGRLKQRTPPSRYMATKFLRDFAEPLDFWTGDDGMLMSYVVRRDVDWQKMLREHYHFFHDSPINPGEIVGREAFDLGQAKERYVYRGSPEDRDDWPTRTRLWLLCDEPTPFPVIEYVLKVPV